MITTALLYFFYAGIYFFLLLLPTGGDLNSNIATALDEFATYWNMLDSVMPVGTLFTVLLLYLAFETIILSYKVINWIIKKIRGSG